MQRILQESSLFGSGNLLFSSNGAAGEKGGERKHFNLLLAHIAPKAGANLSLSLSLPLSNIYCERWLPACINVSGNVSKEAIPAYSPPLFGALVHVQLAESI